MIEIPEEERLRIFNQSFVCGAIFLYEKYEFDDGSKKSKFLLVLNPQDQDGICHFYLTTSRVTKIMSNPILKESCYLIPAGEVDCFPKDTVINIRDVKPMQSTLIQQKYIKHFKGESLIYKQKMPDNIMSDIRDLVLQSRDLTPQQKIRIFPSP